MSLNHLRLSSKCLVNTFEHKFVKSLLWNSNPVIRPSKRTFFLSQCAQEELTIKVPSMGDSITEGTVIEWSKQIGDQVDVDDVVAVIETDKVSVDIRAPASGVLLTMLASVEDTVEVGQDLMVLDTDGALAAAAPPPVDQTSVESLEEPPPTSAAAAVTPPGTGQMPLRVPMIKFLGKRSLLPPHPHSGCRLFDLLLGCTVAPPPPQSASPPPPSSAVAPVPSSQITRSQSKMKKTEEVEHANFFELEDGAMYGRPLFTDEEMEAIDLGGNLPENW